MKRAHMWLLAALLVTPFIVSAEGRRQQAPATTVRVGTIDVAGLRRYTPDQVIAVSGLRVGQPYDGASMDGAVRRLIESGLFRGARYRWESAGDQVRVTLDVDEAAWTLPVVFDNFIWWSDDEIANAVSQEMPTFDGTMPETDGAVAAITRALERLLAVQKIAGHVTQMITVNFASGEKKRRFMITGVPLPICALHFPQAAGLKESAVIEAASFLLHGEYSRVTVAAAIQGNLVPLYRNDGYLRVQFQTPQVRFASSSECPSGVVVSVPVDEGPVFTWEKHGWTGNAGLSTKELDAAFGMRSGEVASASKVDKGLAAVKQAYGRKGYLDFKLTTAPSFDDPGRRVAYQIAVTEGPQFKMAHFVVTGFADNDAKTLAKEWQLREGQIYNASHVQEFLRSPTVVRMSVAVRPKRFTVEQKVDRQALTVDVALTAK